MRPIILGIFAAFFFSITFILNRAMELSGGNWMWSASLRYIFMVPFLVGIVLVRKNVKPLLTIMKETWPQWMLWSSVGFGLFYAPLCFAAAFAPGWLTASTWQITIISGSLLAPLFYITITTPNGSQRVKGRIPFRGLSMSLIILLGIVMMQIEHASSISLTHALFGIIPIIIASFAYPLGNRKMMEVCAGRLDSYQRVLGMTLASLPFWFVLSLFGLLTTGMPSLEQTAQSLIVAISSGVLATVLFFQATDLVRGNMQKLAVVEATQSFEVLFAVIGEVLLLSAELPSLLSWIGMFLIVIGLILQSYVSQLSISKQNQKAAKNIS
jgi:uncharacterized membrane protein